MSNSINEYIQKILVKESRETSTLKWMAEERHEIISKPHIFITWSSTSIANGIDKIIQAIQHWKKENNIEIEIKKIGPTGLLFIEPSFYIQIPGKARLLVANARPDFIPDILNAILSNINYKHHIFCQFPIPGTELWEGIPLFSEKKVFACQKRIITALSGLVNPDNIFEYIAYGGYKALAKSLRYYTAENVISIVEKSGLRGRSGSGFSTGKKWKLASQLSSEQRYLICNADESDPGAFAIRNLTESNPHQLIEGITIAAYAIGANKAYIFLPSAYNHSIHLLKKALEDAEQQNLTGHNILDSGYNLQIVIKTNPGAFVCGEETALINSIEGKRGMPRPKPPYPTQSGLFEKPTVINNAETLMHLPHIIIHGPEWFTQTGTPDSFGTKLFAVSGKVNQTCLVEVPLGTPVSTLFEQAANGIKDDKKLKVVQIGGPAGNLIPPELLDTKLSYEDLASKQITMGTGGIVFFDESTCLVDYAKQILNFFMKESCGKCIPCREGTRNLYGILLSITQRPTDEKGNETLQRFKGIMQIERLARVMKSTSLCGLGQNASNILSDTLKYFRTEVEEHLFDRKCSANQCRELRTFEIDVDKCTGCTACVSKCPTQAIIGSARKAHFIISQKCIGCGACFNVCKFSAIFIK